MFLLLLILQFIETISVDPRAVEVNIETSFLFRPGDLFVPNSAINSIKNLILGLDKHFRAETPEFRAKKSGELTKFLQYVGAKLIKQDDEYLRNLTIALKSTIHEFFNHSKILKDKAMELHIIDTLDDLDKLPIKDIKSSIKLALENDNTILHKVVRIFDRFYNETDVNSLQDIAAHIAGDIENCSIDVNRIVRGALNFIIFKRLKSLNDTEKDSLYAELNKIVINDVGRLNSNTETGIHIKEVLNKEIKFDDIETPSKVIDRNFFEKVYHSKEEPIIRQTEKVSDLEYSAEEKSNIRDAKEKTVPKYRAEDKLKSEGANNLPKPYKGHKEYLLQIETKNGGIKISIPKKHDQEELTNKSIGFKENGISSKKSNKRTKEKSKTRNKHRKGLSAGHKHTNEKAKHIIRGKQQSRRNRQISTDDVKSLEVIKQEGDALLKQVEEEGVIWIEVMAVIYSYVKDWVSSWSEQFPSLRVTHPLDQNMKKYTQSHTNRRTRRRKTKSF